MGEFGFPEATFFFRWFWIQGIFILKPDNREKKGRMACLGGSQTGADGYFGGAVRVIVGDASLGFWDLMVG